MTTYKIEGLVDGQWSADHVGEEMTFDTQDEAERAADDLAVIFQCCRETIRVVAVDD